MFRFDVDPAALFAERAGQFARWGVPEAIVARVRDRVEDMWGDGPAGWTPVWAGEALAARERGEWLTAALCWGAARFPCLATPSRRRAYAEQLSCYRRAVGPDFARWVLDVPYRGGTTAVPAHVWRRGTESLLVVCGGVDTWKIELHRTAVAAASQPDVTVAVVDMPGTGESAVPLAPDVDDVLAGAVAEIAARAGVRRTAFLGLSFGGHWAAKLAKQGAVDAAVDIGGPIGARGVTGDLTELPNGMGGIVGNALGLGGPPGPVEADTFARGFSLLRQGLLDRPLSVPLLAVNGSEDPYVPPEDTTVFEEDARGAAWLVPGAGHCAAEHLPRLLPAALDWIRARLLAT